MIVLVIDPIDDLVNFEAKKKADIETENAGLKLPAGFSTSALADSIGRAWHMCVIVWIIAL
jgi:hypothetical protein